MYAVYGFLSRRILIQMTPTCSPAALSLMLYHEVIASLQTHGKEIPKGLAGIRKRIGEGPNTAFTFSSA